MSIRRVTVVVGVAASSFGLTAAIVGAQSGPTPQTLAGMSSSQPAADSVDPALSADFQVKSYAGMTEALIAQGRAAEAERPPRRRPAPASSTPTCATAFFFSRSGTMASRSGTSAGAGRAERPKRQSFSAG